ncbi:plastocyanin [Mycobacterium sp. MAA66]|uniref:cupredoxin domain-containing protein n=1 Tax=Mycobacterium sp. MAA66 TaxID=3156297 RepID=UPI003512FAFC
MSRTLAIAAACCLALAGAGCSSSAPEASTASPPPTSLPAPTGPVITISALNYGDPLAVAPGAQITVVNKDDVPHTVTSKSKGQFDARAGAGGRATFTAPTEPGDYPFYCIYHPMMIGTLTVK